MSMKILALIAAIIALISVVVYALLRPAASPAPVSPAAYYQAHPNVPNPRAGSFTKSAPGTYEYQTPKAKPPAGSTKSAGGTYEYTTPKANPPK